METKKKNIITFLKNLLLYTLLFAGSYYLYHHYNTDPRNIPHTDFSFVYAQF